MTDTATTSVLSDEDAAAFRHRCVDFMESRPEQRGAPTAEQSRQFHADAAAAEPALVCHARPSTAVRS